MNKTIFTSALILLLFVFFSCPSSQVSSREPLPPKPKKNSLQDTVWRHSKEDMGDTDVIYHFVNDKEICDIDPVSYDTPSIIDKNILRKGTYKLKGNRVKIIWGKLSEEKETGDIDGIEMSIYDSKTVKPTKFLRIK